MDQPYVPKRVWREYLSEEWRTDFPPKPDFEGEEFGEWQDDDYARELSPSELAALIDAGIAEPPPADITIAQDAGDRDAFFAALAAPVSPPPADGGGTRPRKPPKSEPPVTPNRSKRGASDPGEIP